MTLASFPVSSVMHNTDCHKTSKQLFETMDLYPPSIHKGDLSPDSFGAEVDKVCNEINGACKGFGTDEKYVTVHAYNSCPTSLS